ncbi:MAG: type II toxin-antitoxin system prevent-host-death family antitoxin [Eubacteriales bacterium]|nr:type II toxin-antitoxin system prevent-host-death family antitoxin [Eubacteriales bacterium]
MTAVSVFEAKANLSKYISVVAAKSEPYVVIMKNGKPVAKLVPYDEDKVRLGVGKDIIPKMGGLDEFNEIDTESAFAGNGGLI